MNHSLYWLYRNQSSVFFMSLKLPRIPSQTNPWFCNSWDPVILSTLKSVPTLPYLSWPCHCLDYNSVVVLHFCKIHHALNFFLLSWKTISCLKSPWLLSVIWSTRARECIHVEGRNILCKKREIEYYHDTKPIAGYKDLNSCNVRTTEYYGRQPCTFQ